MSLHEELLASGDVNGAITAANKAVRIGPVGDQLKVFRFIGLVYHFRRQDRKTAMHYYQFGLQIARTTGNLTMEGLFSTSIGSIYRVTERFSEAAPYLKRAYKIGQESGSLDILLPATGQRALLLEQWGKRKRFGPALKLYLDNMSKAYSLSKKGTFVDFSTNGAKLLNYLQRYEESASLFERAELAIDQLLPDEDPQYKEMWFNVRHGELLLNIASPEAEQRLRRGLELAQARGQTDAIAAAEGALARLAD